MRRLFFLGLWIITWNCHAQQATKYNLYLLNAYILNPAYAGTHNNVECVLGTRQQWFGVAGAPMNMFVSFNMCKRKNYGFKSWHGFGGFVEQDKRGVFTQKSVYGTYAYHFLLNNGLRCAFGIGVGMMNIGIINAGRDANDPALNLNEYVNVTVYPQFIPGMRFYNKKFFMDLSFKNIYKNEITEQSKKFGEKTIGDSKLYPHYFWTVGRKFFNATKEYMFVPNIHIQGSVMSKPLVDISFLTYYMGRIGTGFNYTVNNSFTLILNAALKKNVVLGMSYNMNTNKLRYAGFNTWEVLLAFTPGTEPSPRDLAECPSFDF